jgi:hypothetical protein
MENKKLILIGYWYNEYKPMYPNPKDFVDGKFWEEIKESTGYSKEEIAKYLDEGNVTYSYRGFSQCRICGTGLGSCERSDGRYNWPDMLSHYIIEHNVKLPKDFILDIIDKSYRILKEDMSDCQFKIDEDFWLKWGGNSDKKEIKRNIVEEAISNMSQELSNIIDEEVMKSIRKNL